MSNNRNNSFYLNWWRNFIKSFNNYDDLYHTPIELIIEYFNADLFEVDSSGNLLGFGSHADFDYYADEVINGLGYYDDNGHYHRYSNYW